MYIDKHLIARLVSEIVSEEFIRERMYGVCLPASLLLFNHLKNLGIKMMYGKLVYDSLILAPVHIWTEIEGVKYDPTIAIAETYLTKENKSYFNVTECKYYPEDPIITNLEDRALMDIFYKVRYTENIGDYFEVSSPILKTIRNRVNDRVKIILKHCKKNVK